MTGDSQFQQQSTMVNAATREKLSNLDAELEQMRVMMERIEHASEVGADVRSSLKPSKEEEAAAALAKERARAPLIKAKSQYHEQRFDTPEHETATDKAIRKAKTQWRQHDHDSKTLGKLEFLHHLGRRPQDQ